MKAVNDYIVVSRIKDGPKKVAGLIMSDKVDTENRYIRGTIVSIGVDIEGISEGSTIQYDRHAGHDISFNDEVFQVIRVRDVVIVE